MIIGTILWGAYIDEAGTLLRNKSFDNGKLEISGARHLQSKGSGSWKEFGDVEYRRVFSVPQSIDVGKVNADFKEGVLRLHLPKTEAAKPRRIEISAL